MAGMKDKLNEVKNIISNQDEATKVMSIIMEITEGYEDKLMEIEKRQTTCIRGDKKDCLGVFLCG